MKLFRVHAFAVKPRRTSDIRDQMVGGPIKISNEISSLIDENIEESDFLNQSEIAFNFSGPERSNSTRDLVISYGYDDEEKSNLAAQLLAQKLSLAMDKRSKPTLFLLASKSDGDIRKITLWTFPSDTAFKLEMINNIPTLYILSEVFSQSSLLRKAVLYQGNKLIRSDFTTGFVLDNQATGYVSNYWMRIFLESDFFLKEIMGTRVLATALKDTFNTLSDQYEKDKVFSSIISTQHLPREIWSFLDFANEMLDGKARDEFLKQIANKNCMNEKFSINKQEFKSLIGKKIYYLESGVSVISPLDEIGKSVYINNDEEPRLECSGIIQKELVRTK